MFRLAIEFSTVSRLKLQHTYLQQSEDGELTPYLLWIWLMFSLRK